MDCSKIKVVKKDGTREDFNVQKVLSAISKSAERAMITFSRAERNFICEFVEEKAEEMDQELIPIAQMHNIVEGALEKVNPLVAKSYRYFFVVTIQRRNSKFRWLWRKIVHEFDSSNRRL